MKTECVICNAPLGQESRDLDYPVCHEHRKCAECQLDVSPAECNWAVGMQLAIKHARCQKSEGLTLQAQCDLSNLARLLTETTQRVASMSFEDKYIYLKMLQSEAARVSVLTASNRKEINERLKSEREKSAKENARAQAETSTRPVSKTPDEPNEKAISWFMSTYKIAARANAIKEMRNRDKAIKALEQAGLPYEKALAIAEEQLAKKYKVSVQ